MATGDTSDMLARLKSLLPVRWFALSTTFADAVFAAIADQLAWAYGLFEWVVLQTRIATATGVFLDLIAFDFLGLAFRRRTAEADDAFRARIMKEILRERVTRAGVSGALSDLTGRVPAIFEPARPQDTGGYGVGGVGYGVAGGYGSLMMPYECLIAAKRPTTAGIPHVGGYGVALAYNTPSASEYASLQSAGTQIGDAEIFDTIERTKALGTTVWARIDTDA